MNRTIGEFLRARRERLTPEEAGVTVTNRRRVPGLRRDELALLAGISTEYYTRLEQGRDQHPSPQVLGALARALQLEESATAHLHELAAPKRKRRRATEKVAPGLVQLLTRWHDTPAYVSGRYLDVLAANPLAVALSPTMRPGTNILRSVLLDPGVRDLFGEDYQAGLPRVVASLRAAAGPDVDDPRLIDLVGELSVRSEEFRRLWARHDVRPLIGSGTHTFHHPQVGPLTLHYEKFQAAGAPDQTLVVYHPAPGSEQALQLLALQVPAPAAN